MRPAIIDTGIGNFGSILNALRRVGADPYLASEPAALADATHLILPGVGSFDVAMRTLREHHFESELSHRVLDSGTPFLGICLGMQLLGSGSEEGELPGLGWLPGRTVRFRQHEGDEPLRVPHIGWNGITPQRPSALLNGTGERARFYFVHSYHYVDDGGEDTLALSEYGYPFAAVVRHENILGTQFHPERSGPNGMRLLRNFLQLSVRD